MDSVNATLVGAVRVVNMVCWTCNVMNYVKIIYVMFLSQLMDDSNVYPTHLKRKMANVPVTTLGMDLVAHKA